MYAMMKELRDVALEITVATAPIKKQAYKNVKHKHKKLTSSFGYRYSNSNLCD